MEATSVVALITGITVVAKVTWELYLRPLARQHIPGPKRAAVSDIWDYLLQVRGQHTFTFHRLFERYGPVVRVGPNRVIFHNIDTLKTIYSNHRFSKSSWYSVFTFGGGTSMFATRRACRAFKYSCRRRAHRFDRDPAYHARCRRIAAPAYRGETMRAASSLLLQEMQDLVDRLRRDCADGGSVDVLKLFPHLTLDMLGLTVFGVRFDQVASGQGHVVEKYLKDWLIDKIIMQSLPAIVRRLPIRRLQEIAGAEAAVANYVRDLYEKVDEKSPEERWSVLATYKAYRDEDTGEPAPVTLVVGDLSMLFFAGTETTATALVYVVYLLAARQEMWETLSAETDAVDLQADDLLDTLRGLPYLNAFIREVLRVYGPGPSYFERLVPAGGATLEGYFIPAGTEVGGQAYSSHFNEQFFPESNEVDPLRWVQQDKITGQYVNREDIKPEMNANWFPYGVGVRSCAGRPLADLEMVLTTATLVKNFRVHLDTTTTPESMSPVEFLVMGPQAGRCMLRFEYAPDATI